MAFPYIGDEILAGRITDEERVRRLFEIERLEQEGLTDSQISTELGLSLPVIKRAQKYLENLKTADVTPEVLAEKRSELYLEYSELIAEAKKQFELYKNPIACGYCEGTGKVIVASKDKQEEVTCGQCKGLKYMHYPKDANRFLVTWAEIIEKKAKLFGLDNIKSDSIFQFNQIHAHQYIPDIRISGQAKKQADRLSNLLKENHEKSVAEKEEI